MTLLISTSPPITNHLPPPPPTSGDHHTSGNHHPPPTTASNLTVSSWTSNIAHHCKTGRLTLAATTFTNMRLAGVDPNHITLVTLISACTQFPSHALSLGASVHALVHKLGFVSNVKVGTAVIDMYCKCNQMGLAKLWFGKMGVKNKVTWNTMVSGLMRNGDVGNALQVFDEMPERDVVSYTALIDGFVKRGEYELALEWFLTMQVDGVEPDHVTVVAVLSACANLGALKLGLWVHRFVLLNRNMKDNIRVNNSLIDMYARCGCVDFAVQVFDNMLKRNLVTWNSIIVGFALNGNVEQTLKYFYLMQKDGFEPDGVTFTGALTACSHAGLVDEGRKLFDMMKNVYKIVPRIEHYGCLVDLYSRAGMLEEALNVVKNMPMVPNEVVYGSVLAACKAAANIKLAEKLMRFISEVDPSGDSNYVLLSNMYAAGGDWRKASNVRRRMKSRGIEKNPGVSCIEVNGVVKQFVAGDQSHIESERIYDMLENLSRELMISGYLPDANVSVSSF